MSETTCPVFYPESHELDNLVSYLEGIEAEYPGIGICKLIPPAGWYDRTYDPSDLPINIGVPIRQEVNGKHGTYDVGSCEMGPMTVAQFSEYAKWHGEDYLAVKEAEVKFWKSIGKGKDPIYGADIDGTLFQGVEHARSRLGRRGWTLNTALKDILRMLPESIPGVNTTMVYVGMWRAMFAFHVEDLDLYSINYLHSGAPKSWYSILPERRKRLEAIAEGAYAHELRHCREYLRHKTKLFSPTCLNECGLPFDTVVQKAGEFVVTFPGAYHAGFNHGFNLAEATNFATARWLEIGKKARICLCKPDSVYIDFAALEACQRRQQAQSAAHIIDLCGSETSSPQHTPQALQKPATAASAHIPARQPAAGASGLGPLLGKRRVQPLRTWEDELLELEVQEAVHTERRKRPKHRASARVQEALYDWLPPMAETAPQVSKTHQSEVPAVDYSHRQHASHGVVQKGDFMEVVRKDSYLLHVVGTITRVEGKLGRLHVKGTRKHLDKWVPLRHCRVLSEEI